MSVIHLTNKDIEEKKNIEKVETLFLNINTHRTEEKQDLIAVEQPIHILLNREHYATILCTPTDINELVIGNITSEGLIDSIDDIKEIKAKENNEYHITLTGEMDLQKRLNFSPSFKRLILSACGSSENWLFSKLIDRINIPKVEVEYEFKAQTILEASKQLNTMAIIYRQTGGVHAAALHRREGTLISFFEDTGRHNAIDKVIGQAIIKKWDFKETFLVSTGRLSGDMVIKAARVRIPIIASISSVLNSGVDVANKTGVTLIGFIRGQRMNIYTNSGRVII
ncbi:MAG: FdhD protein [Thermoproteota archaeon]|nr:FdhD protein [Thermoproteota archaeon]